MRSLAALNVKYELSVNKDIPTETEDFFQIS